MKKIIYIICFLIFLMVNLHAEGNPITDLINPDGTINRESGYEGNLDFSGYDIELDEEKGIVLKAKTSNSCEDGSTWGEFEGEALQTTIIEAMIMDQTGNIYIGGDFNLAGEIGASYIAMWDGSSWHALGQGLNRKCTSLVFNNGGQLIAGGHFTMAGGLFIDRIARWDGTTWHAIGDGLNGPVETIVVSPTHLYVGGSFSQAGTASASNIAKWDGANWSSVGLGFNDDVEALAIHPSTGQIYAGGRFTQSGSNPRNYIAYLDGSTWYQVGSGLNNWCYTLLFDEETLYAGGRFTLAGTSNANYVAKWNGTNWSALKSGLDNYCYALALDVEGNLYAGGEFTNAEGNPANYIAKWNGSAWSAIGDGFNNDCRALLMDDAQNFLYAGGTFTTADGLGTDAMAFWDGEQWRTFENGIRNSAIVRALEMDANGDIYIGGEFTSIGGVSAARIAKWDGISWTALGSGLNDRCHTIKTDGNGNVYAGGSFTIAGGNTAIRVAKWDGTAWSPLGGGFPANTSSHAVYTLLVDGTDVYAGGLFKTSSGSPGNYIAKWDGTSWSGVGGGFSSNCYDLEMDANGTLYACGIFTLAGGATVNKIAKWDGSSWSSIGGGSDYLIQDMEFASNGDLYVCGSFSMIGGQNIDRIARWDGTTWSDVGGGLPGINSTAAYALTIDDLDNIYLGGQFTSIGVPSVAANSIAKWDGSQWCALAGGLTGLGITGSGCYELFHTGEGLIAGGVFTHADGQATSGLAHWRYDCTAPENVVVDLGTDPNRVTISWDPVPGVFQYQVRYRRVLTTSWTNVIANDPVKVIQGLVQNKLYDYRVRSKCPDGTWSEMTVIEKFRTVKCQHPVELVSTQLLNNKVRVEWAPYTYADKYQIWYRVAGSSDAWTSLVTYQLGMVSRVITNLADGVTYEWKVRSYCEVSYGPWSDLHYFTNMTLRTAQSDFSIASLYPNPASTVLNLTLSSEEKGDVMISVSNALGRTIMENTVNVEKGLNSHHLDIASLSAGYYYIIINKGKEKIIKKFIKLD